MLSTVIEALVQTYNHVVLDIGSAADVAVERFAPLAQRAVLVAADPALVVQRAEIVRRVPPPGRAPIDALLLLLRPSRP